MRPTYSSISSGSSTALPTGRGEEVLGTLPYILNSDSCESHRSPVTPADAASFIKSTEGQLTSSWQHALDQSGVSDPVAALQEYEATMAKRFKTLVRMLDEDESTGSGLLPDGATVVRNHKHKQAAMHAAFAWDPSDTGPTHDTFSAPASTQSASAGSNFCATGYTDTPQPTSTTAPQRDDTVHVAVQWELESDTAQIAAALSNDSKLLSIPYRSMSTRLHVEVGAALQSITVIVDSGAAQSAVSARWLRNHPDLWDARIASPHRFHGITGEKLHTDGVVKLRLKLGEYWLETWAHVFLNMRSDMLLGTNALIENALVIDCASRELYPKAHPEQTAQLDYRLTTVGDMLQVQRHGETVHSVRLNPTSRTVFRQRKRETIPVALLKDVVVQPGPAPEGAESGLPFQLTAPYTGSANHDIYVSAEALRSQYGGLLALDAQISASTTLGYLPVANTSEHAIHIPAGTIVGYASTRDIGTSVTSDEQGVGRLTFQVQLASQETGTLPVTEELLREQRGLDLRDCRDLGKEGAPLLDAEQHRELVSAFIDMEKAISVDPKRPGTSDYMLIRINTGDAPPQASKPYSIPYAYQEYVRKEIEKLLRNGLISPCTSSWASPVLVVVKKDHTGENVNIKLATDLRKLNAVTEMDTGAIGEMHEILDKFRGRPYVSCCDVSSGYYSFLIHPEDRHKLCFVLPMSMGGTTFCWNRAPYGVARLPAEFSRAIMTILDGTQEDISSYIDDLTVHAKDFKSHVRALRVMMRRLILAGVCLKGSKCLILPPRLELLGFDITPQGVHKQRKKCREFKDYPTPTSREEVQKYLGGVQFYRRFVDNLATIASPLTDLLKKSRPWSWTERHQSAFETLNEILFQDIALSFPDLKDPQATYWVFTDASDVAAAAILMQLQWDERTGQYVPRTLAHFSKVFDDTQRKWAIYEKESAAMMLAVTHWRKYLLGRKFTCFVDSSVALTMLSKQRHTPKMQRWGLLLQEYMPGMAVSFKRSEENGGSDALSRKASFSQYVPQPSDQMPLDDSLYDRLYHVDTAVRGRFGLYQPKDPVKLAEMWGVAFDSVPSETIAFAQRSSEAAAAGSLGTGDDAIDAMAAQAICANLPLCDDKAADRLLAMAQAMVSTWLDPASSTVASPNLEYEALVSHYTQYVDACVATLGARPRIACLSEQDPRSAMFRIGCELAGCQPVDAHQVSLDSVHGLHVFGEDGAVAQAQLLTLDLPQIVPTQVESADGLLACNFDIQQACNSMPVNGYRWRQCANRLLSRPPPQLEHSVHHLYKGQHTNPTVMHGQLLSAQMVATYMHTHHGMPLWNAHEVRHHPSRQALLREWAASGFERLDESAEHDDVAWQGMVQSAADAMNMAEVRVLTRETPIEPRATPMAPPLESWTERWAQYQRRRAELDQLPSPRPRLRAPHEDHPGLRPSQRLFLQDSYPDPSTNEPLRPRSSFTTSSTIREEGGENDGNADHNFSATVAEQHVTTNLPKATLPIVTDSSVQQQQPTAPITREEQDADPSLLSVRQLLASESVATTTQSKQAMAARATFFIADDGLLKHRSTPLNHTVERHRVVVPLARRRALLEAYHTSPIYGHRGYQTLYELLSRNYYWSGMYSDCVDFVSRCEVCAVRKPFHKQFAAEIKARPTPSRPFHSIALDIKGPLLTTDNNNSYILVVVCLLTRFVVAVPLPNTNQVTIARALMDHVFCIHGFPHNIQVDNAAYFKGTTMQSLTQLFGIKLISVLPFQPTSNGQAEAMVKSISHALQRNGNALRSWDTMLQLVVHGINCTETNHLGVTPFYALFGRDPVGLAELEWPDLQRLDSDGDTFVTDLATRIRAIWSDLKATSDAVKRAAAERANAQFKEKFKRPLKPGDYVFVEHGDQDHSKRLGKAGLPRRRRFKVVEYHPDRGYVKIDPDGLNLLDKVSLNRVMRAPSDYTVVDNSEPITKVERRGGLDLPLPPGWRAILKHGATKDYQEYVGPGGKGQANTALQAWREFNGDPVYMPQPKLPAAKTTPTLPASAAVPMLPPLYTKVPPSVAPPAKLASQPSPAPVASPITPAINANPSPLTRTCWLPGADCCRNLDLRYARTSTEQLKALQPRRETRRCGAVRCALAMRVCSFYTRGVIVGP